MSGTFWQRLCRGVRQVHERSNWATFLGDDWVERIMGLPVTDRFHAKQGRSTGRLRLEKDGRTLNVYLKRHYRLSRWAGWLATLWPGRAWTPALQELRHLEQARGAGIPVPASVAAGEFVGPWGQLQSFLAIEELEGMRPLHEAIPLASTRLGPADFASWKSGLAVEMARLTAELHRRRWFHKDLYLCHFYVREQDIAAGVRWRNRVHLIDLHRLGQHRWTWRRWQAKDLGQLLFSSLIEGVRPRDRLEFWRAYAAAMGTDRLSSWVRRAAMVKAHRYERHNRAA